MYIFALENDTEMFLKRSLFVFDGKNKQKK